MRSFLFPTITLCVLILTASFQKTDVLTILSPAFTKGGTIPIRYTCEGENINPPLNIAGIPSTAKSLAMIVFEPNADTKGDYTHWIAWNLPLSGEIPEHYNGGVQGMNGSQKYGYTGMCPKGEGLHHFCFRAYALDTVMSIKKSVTKAEFLNILAGHVLAEGELTGVFSQGNILRPNTSTTVTYISPKPAKKKIKHHRRAATIAKK